MGKDVQAEVAETKIGRQSNRADQVHQSSWITS